MSICAHELEAVISEIQFRVSSLETDSGPAESALTGELKALQWVLGLMGVAE